VFGVWGFDKSRASTPFAVTPRVLNIFSITATHRLRREPGLLETYRETDFTLGAPLSTDIRLLCYLHYPKVHLPLALHFDSGEKQQSPQNLLHIRIPGKAEYDTQKCRYTNGNADP
jgi:hypothetical protein